MTSADWRDGVVCAAVAVLTPAKAVATPGLTAPAPLRKSRREIDRSTIQHPLKGAIALVCRHARLQHFKPVVHEIKLGPPPVGIFEILDGIFNEHFTCVSSKSLRKQSGTNRRQSSPGCAIPYASGVVGRRVRTSTAGVCCPDFFRSHLSRSPLSLPARARK